MFEQLGTMHALLPTGLGLLALLVAAVIIDLIVKHILIRAVRALAKRSSTGWVYALIQLVVQRENSRISGNTSEEIDTKSSG